jgi:hypothetical protein
MRRGQLACHLQLSRFTGGHPIVCLRAGRATSLAEAILPVVRFAREGKQPTSTGRKRLRCTDLRRHSCEQDREINRGPHREVLHRS